MKHCIGVVLSSVLVLAAAGSAAAQDTVNVRVLTEPSGARYSVDGQVYTYPMSFTWPKGSKHIVTIAFTNLSDITEGQSFCGQAGNTDLVQYDPLCRVRYSFGGWESDAGTLPSASLLTQVITVDPSMTFLKAKFSVEYKVDVALAPGPGNGPSGECLAKANRAKEHRQTGEGVGVVFVNGQCFDYSGTVWLPEGEIVLQALPFDGYAFLGWHLDGATPVAAITAYKLRGPAVLVPRFTSAKRVQFYTEPIGLKVRVDSTDILTINPKMWVDAVPIPGRYDWVPGSKHTIGAPSPQMDQVETGKMWVFDSWDWGGGQDAVYTADEETNKMAVLTAKFVPGVSVIYTTEPRGLRLSIDGRENWPLYSFVWGQGTKHTMSAPADQLDSRGRKWTFKGWKHGGPAAQEAVIDEKAVASGGVYYTATYEALPQVVLQSSVPGTKIEIDGAECTVPCRIDKPAGTQVRVTVPASMPISDSSRYEFTGWSDGASQERVITMNGDVTVLQANYRMAHRLVAMVEPAEGGTIMTDPGSADGFFADATALAVQLELKPGYKFRRWEGDLTGTIPSGTLSMSAGRIILARLEKVPYLPPRAVRNAAGPTPVEGVAAGSLVAIEGANLTSQSVNGPASPLVQTLGNIVVMVGDRILPLASVAPERVVALLPSDLEPGEYELKLRPETGGEVSSTFTVVRNAPGLFSTTVEEQTWAQALREDGSVVTPVNRAKRGEVITLFATGLGALNRALVDGFATPQTPQYSLVDPADVLIGGTVSRALWAGAMPGYTALGGVRLRVPQDAPAEMEVRVAVNGAESNTVVVPVE